MSERPACSVATQHRSSQRYSAKRADAEPRLIARMLEIVREHPRFGYRRIAKLLQREGHRIGFDRTYHLWRRQGLKVPRKPKKQRRVGDSHQGLHSSSCGKTEPCLGLGLCLVSVHGLFGKTGKSDLALVERIGDNILYVA